MGFLASWFRTKKKGKPRRSSKSLGQLIAQAGDRMAFNWKVRQALYRHLSVQLANGVTTEVALDSFQARLKRRKRVSSEQIVGDVARRMRNGTPLAVALKPWIPHNEFGVISGGDLAGKLPKSLELVIESKRRVDRVIRAFRTAATSPMIYAIAIFATLVTVGMVVAPDLEQVLPKEKATGLVYGFYVASEAASSGWALVPVVLVVLAAAVVRYSFPRWTGKSRIIAERYFFPYTFYRDVNGYTWLMAFLTLLRSGVADVEILKRQIETANPWLKERLSSVFTRMDNGQLLSAALLGEGREGMRRSRSRNVLSFGFPNPDVIDDISSLEGFLDFPEKAATLASQWAEELENTAQDLAKQMGFWMEIAMYIVMGLMFMATNDISAKLSSMSTI